jgi:hypothetical protein
MKRLRCPTGKRTFRTYAEAVMGLASALDPSTPRRGVPEEVRAYECSVCGSWHLTSTVDFRKKGKGRGKRGRKQRAA